MEAIKNLFVLVFWEGSVDVSNDGDCSGTVAEGDEDPVGIVEDVAVLEKGENEGDLSGGVEGDISVGVVNGEVFEVVGKLEVFDGISKISTTFEKLLVPGLESCCIPPPKNILFVDDVDARA
jgi:hypothetical protein